jgi:hypothetical protein
MSTGDEINNRLESFNKTFGKDLDNVLERDKKRMRHYWTSKFHKELDISEVYMKDGTSEGILEAMLHKMSAERIKDFLKSLDDTWSLVD